MVTGSGHGSWVNAVWMAMAMYAQDGVSYLGRGYIHALVTSLGVDEEKAADDLHPIVRQLNEAHRYGLSPEELQAIAGNLTSASFFTRDETGALAFNHLSFENYFLARKLRGALERAGSDGMASRGRSSRTTSTARKPIGPTP